MTYKELTTFKNFLVYCSLFADLFLKGSHVLYQCRIAQRHFNFQYNNNRELDWLMENMLIGISYVHDEFGGSRFKEDFIMRKRKVEKVWIGAITRRYLELAGKPKESSPKTRGLMMKLYFSLIIFTSIDLKEGVRDLMSKFLGTRMFASG